MLFHDLTNVNCRALSPAELVALRVQLNKTIRRDTLAVNSIPLMAPQTWARCWQTCHRSALASALKAYRKVLASIESIIGPPPEFFRPRPATRADARIARLYRPAIEATASFIPLVDDEPVKAEPPRSVATMRKEYDARLSLAGSLKTMGYMGTAVRVESPAPSPVAVKVRKRRLTYIEKYHAPRIKGRIVAA